MLCTWSYNIIIHNNRLYVFILDLTREFSEFTCIKSFTTDHILWCIYCTWVRVYVLTFALHNTAQGQVAAVGVGKYSWETDNETRLSIPSTTAHSTSPYPAQNPPLRLKLLNNCLYIWGLQWRRETEGKKMSILFVIEQWFLTQFQSLPLEQ
jgi:hypothetical protein